MHAARARPPASADAEPQAPSIVALRPFLSAATISGKPGARWISRVRSLSSRIAEPAADRGVPLGITRGARLLSSSLVVTNVQGIVGLRS